MSKCPCGLGSDVQSCCGPIISGKNLAKSPETLMRARYTAYVQSEIGFLKESYDPKHRSEFDEESAKTWSKKSKWQGLEILKTEKGGPDDKDGIVEFVANYTYEGKNQTHHEIAEFRKESKDGRWYFVDGKIASVAPVTRDGPKVGRNDLCPCGSGKKYKKCCMAI